VPRRNRVDPFGDLHAVEPRGIFTGNRGCLVDEDRRLVRHHRGQLWITCVTEFSDWKAPLDAPRRWTPLFFLDDAVALAAGHRPCGLCRREEYRSYQDAVSRGLGSNRPVSAVELNRMLSQERLARGGGLQRSGDRKLWSEDPDLLPDGAMIVAEGDPRLVVGDRTLRFDFTGWADPRPRPRAGRVAVLTPPTSVLALTHGYSPVLHPTVGKASE